MKKSKRRSKILTLSKETIVLLAGGEDLIPLLTLPFPIVTGSTIEVCLTTSLDTTG